MPDEHRERQARAASRRSWPMRTFPLGGEPSDDISRYTTATERLAMMWPLSRNAWLLAGRPLPDYARHSVPGRVMRPAGRDKDLLDLRILEGSDEG